MNFHCLQFHSLGQLTALVEFALPCDVHSLSMKTQALTSGQNGQIQGTKAIATIASNAFRGAPKRTKSPNR